MGNPNPKPRFKPGNTYGQGRPKISEEVKAARKFNSSEFELAVNRLFFLSVSELVSLVGDKSTPVMDALIGRIALNGIKFGKTDELNYFVERFMGKVSDNVNIQTGGHPSLVDYIAKINQEHDKYRKEMEAINGKKQNLKKGEA